MKAHQGYQRNRWSCRDGHDTHQVGTRMLQDRARHHRNLVVWIERLIDGRIERSVPGSSADDLRRPNLAGSGIGDGRTVGSQHRHRDTANRQTA
jgi:hypothetical protein